VADGGWLTAEGIALALSNRVVVETVTYVLGNALRDRVDHRLVGLASKRGPIGAEVRVEWRAKP